MNDALHGREAWGGWEPNQEVLQGRAVEGGAGEAAVIVAIGN